MRKQIPLYLFAFALATSLLYATVHAQQEDIPPTDPANLELTDGRPPMPPPPPLEGRRPHGGHPKGGHLPPPIRHYFMQLQQEDPEEYERLLKLRMENREQFMKEISERLPRQKNPAEEKFRQLDQQCWELAEQLRATPPPENAEELQEKLNALVAESVDSMIAQTQERLEEIQNRLKQMEALRDRIVQQRLKFYLQAPLYQSKYHDVPPPPRHDAPPPPRDLPLDK